MYRRCMPLLMGAPPAKRDRFPPILHQATKARRRPTSTVDFKGLALKYPLVNPNPVFQVPELSWSPKPQSTPDLPFHVKRVGENDNFPVYTLYMNGNTRVRTVVKGIFGNAVELQKELHKVVGKDAHSEIKSGKIIFDGFHRDVIKKYLLAVGF